jgi:hypothetical protein
MIEFGLEGAPDGTLDGPSSYLLNLAAVLTGPGRLHLPAALLPRLL